MSVHRSPHRFHAFQPLARHHRLRAGISLVLLAAMALGAPSTIYAGDILRGGVTAKNAKRNATARAQAGAEAAEASKIRAQDRLARTTKVVTDMRRLQAAARSAAGASNIPNGLAEGGLKVLTGPNAKWQGANAPTQSGNTVGIKQTDSKALLHWETFHVGRDTTVNFDQSAGGADAGKWIAFNKVFDPAQKPSQIRGKINAQGQVYIINQNGIVFGAGSQINTRALVASSLPINDALVENGLLNNKDGQFLFSKDFAADPTAIFGDVVVEPGALLTSPEGEGGNGGRVMLVGANVLNAGEISTPSGQSILAAGLQVGVAAHAESDPSLRGLDVWVGDVGSYGGTVTNTGLVESQRGSIVAVGKRITQSGVMESSTSVNLNGRIDLLASYGAVGFPGFDPTFQPPFLNRSTGIVEFSPGSTTRILPDFSSDKKIPGSKLSQSSQVNIKGLGIHFASGSSLIATSGIVDIRAGTWPFVDTNNDGFVGSDEFSPDYKQLLLSGGQVNIASGALLDASGTMDAFVPLGNNFLAIQLRGSELADSPLQRSSSLRGRPLLVDLRRSGTYGGRGWIGTPLGDLTGLANITERDIAQLTTRGGSISIAAGDSVVAASGATIDVSGGYFTHEGGLVRTSRLLRDANLVDMHNATPDVTYDGVYDGLSRFSSAKWGTAGTYSHPLAPLGGGNERTHVEGAAAGTLSITAPKMALAAELLGQSIAGPRQQLLPPAQGTLQLKFQSDRNVFLPTGEPLRQSPYAPNVALANGTPDATPFDFRVVDGSPAELPLTAGATFTVPSEWWEEEGGGFGNISIENTEGDISVPTGNPLELPSGGSLTLAGRNITVNSNISAPGGSIAMTAYNYTPMAYDRAKLDGLIDDKKFPAPSPIPSQGTIKIARGVLLDVAGQFVDERPSSPMPYQEKVVLKGGSVALTGYSVLLEPGSLVDASGGVRARPNGKFQYGNGGSISILAGKDPNLSTTVGGKLQLDGTLQAYSVAKGGSLSLQANTIQLGGNGAPEGTLLLQPDFFRKGGFTSYSLKGIGARAADGSYVPGINVGVGTVIEPVAESWRHLPAADARKLTTAMSRLGDHESSQTASIMDADPTDLSGFGFRRLGIDALFPVLLPEGLRQPASLSLSASGYDDSFTLDRIEAIGIVNFQDGAKILTDAGASVRLSGDFVRVAGEITAPGGTIEITGRSSFRLPETTIASFALPTVHLTPAAKLSVAGKTVPLDDPYGWNAGIIHPGGTIKISGNILAEAGSTLDASGTSAVLDFHPSQINPDIAANIPAHTGLTSTPWQRRAVSVRLDSDGGRIELNGSQMLYVDSVLKAHRGGETAAGGTLSISSGRFYSGSENIRTGADTNLYVASSGEASRIASTSDLASISHQLLASPTPDTFLASSLTQSPAGSGGIGFFAMDRFTNGGFDFLDLGFKYFKDADPIPYGGNLEFLEPVSIYARGAIRLAGGGVIRSAFPVSISAPYVAIGQYNPEPLNPADTFHPFWKIDENPKSAYNIAPTTGTGSIHVSAQLIDAGTLVTQDTNRLSMFAWEGEIRGNGVVNVAGDVILQAAQIYPQTLGKFEVFAYDTPDRLGTITILGDDLTPLPLSVGGRLGLYASVVRQAGTLRAPLGSIELGWDGRDSTKPVNSVVGDLLTTPTSLLVSLEDFSVTSVSGVDPRTGADVLFPFGISPDGLKWVDPRGVDITTSGLPERGIALQAESVFASPGSVLDTRGGGDLFSYRWIPGPGGSRDLLGTATDTWAGSKSYSAGDLVLHSGKTWSARSNINPADYTSSPVPGEGLFWSQVPDSYAILPGNNLGIAPLNHFNTGPNSSLLAGDPGYVAPNLRTGESIFLSGNGDINAGFYSLLPRRYALLPGALLVVPSTSAFQGTNIVRTAGSSSRVLRNFTSEEGGNFISGYTTSAFNATPNPVQTKFEILSPETLAQRVEYQVLTGNQFFKSAAERVGLKSNRLLPEDSAPLKIQGNQNLALSGFVYSKPVGSGRPASIDISSNSPILITDDPAKTSSAGAPVLYADLLNSWNAGSLLVGGFRNRDGTGVDVRTNTLTLNAPLLTAGEVILAAKDSVELADGSSIATNGSPSPTETLLIDGDGALVAVSASLSGVARSSTTGADATLRIGQNTKLTGSSVILDSSRSAIIDPSLQLSANALALGAGQISLEFDPLPGGLMGSQFATHLVMEGQFLSSALATNSLTLQSYTTIDFYANGSIAAPAKSLTLLASGLRAYTTAGSTIALNASDIVFSNPNNASTLAAPVTSAGTLEIAANSLTFGENTFSVSGVNSVALSASGGAAGTGDGSFSTTGALRIATPSLTAAQAVSHSISSTGALDFAALPGASTRTPGLGATISLSGSSVSLGSDILLPSGSLVATASGGSISVSGLLSVAGTAKSFFDQTRFTNAGDILLDATGAVQLLAGSRLSLAAASGGGDAGSLTIKSPGGALLTSGSLDASAPAGRKGSVSIDTASIADFDSLAATLGTAGFTRSMDFRVRSEDVSLNNAIAAESFKLAADAGSIAVNSSIDASGQTGGRIELMARNTLTLAPGASLTVAAQRFNNAGKGGHIHLEAGAAVNGSPNAAALLDLQAGSIINLSVAEFVAGDYLTAGTSAFNGRFQGTLHLRAPRSGNDVLIDQIDSTITGASAISVEPFRVYEPDSGTMNIALRNTIKTDNTSFMNDGEAYMLDRLLPVGSPLTAALIITPGVEILNQAGDLTLGLANTTGSPSNEAQTAADWDLSSFRYGTRQAPGILTLRARENLVFNNALSDGFDPVAASSNNGWSSMWLATPSKIESKLPTNLQSWSFNLTAGADFSSVDSGSVVPGTGKVLVGEAHSTFSSQAIINDEKDSTQNVNKISGDFGRTLNHIKINPSLDMGNRYEVIRTGTGDIDISAGSDVQLRNAFSAIYTSGVALPNASQIFEEGDFSVPVTIRAGLVRPPAQSSWDDDSDGSPGTPQQNYTSSFTFSGGDLTLNSMRDIGRYSVSVDSIDPYFDSNNQLPSNWLYRRGELSTTTKDSAGNLVFAGGDLSFGSGSGKVNDASASTSWWVDYSNFFGGVGALGGGSVEVAANRDIVNLHASVPTTARMAGLSSGSPIAPSVDKLLETGGGDLKLFAGRNILSGSYYVERGTAEMVSGGQIAPVSPSSNQDWFPATFFGGDSRFSVLARGDIEVGPATNAFLLPQGLNNRLWYRTHFQTMKPESSINVRSLGGSITHRLTYAKQFNQNDPFLWHIMEQSDTARVYQPWTRFLETNLAFFKDSMTVNLPTLTSYSFGGDVAIVGTLNLFPSSKGGLEVLARDSIHGLNPSGWSDGQVAWIAASLNLSDANPTQFSSIEKPLSGRTTDSGTAYFNISNQINETGSFIGDKASIDLKSALHNPTPLHSNNPNPVLLYASGGDISGLSLYSAKKVQTVAERDITDIAFYIQNTSEKDVSIVSAGRDIIPFNENSSLRAAAGDSNLGNLIADQPIPTVVKTSATEFVSTQALPGDIQIGGLGVLEVLAGRNVDLGTGPNLVDGRGKGITSIGRSRNPFLPFEGAELVVLAGVGGVSGGPAIGLTKSILDFSALKGGMPTTEFDAVTALKGLFVELARIGESALESGDYSEGYALVNQLFGPAASTGDLFTRARDIRTANGGAITIATPGGGVTMASDIFGNPLTPPGIVTEYGGAVSILTNGDVNIGQARIFTLRGGDLTIWSSNGDIAAGNAPKTVVTAPPTRVLIDATSADIQTDLGGLATGGGIGVLAAVENVEPGAVNLIAPEGTVDAGDAGIRATGDIKIAAAAVVNADNIAAGGTSTGVPTSASVAAPNIGGLASGATSSAATSSAASQVTQQAAPQEKPADEAPSLITVEVLGYGGGDAGAPDSETEDEETAEG